VRHQKTKKLTAQNSLCSPYFLTIVSKNDCFKEMQNIFWRYNFSSPKILDSGVRSIVWPGENCLFSSKAKNAQVWTRKTQNKNQNPKTKKDERLFGFVAELSARGPISVLGRRRPFWCLWHLQQLSSVWALPGYCGQLFAAGPDASDPVRLVRLPRRGSQSQQLQFSTRGLSTPMFIERGVSVR